MLQGYLKILQRVLIKFEKMLIKSFKNFQKNLRCLKINAKFGKGWANFGTLSLWNFDVKYYKTFVQKLKEKCKKYYPILSGTCLHRVICFTFSPFDVSSLFRYLQHTLCLNPQIECTRLSSWVNDTDYTNTLQSHTINSHQVESKYQKQCCQMYEVFSTKTVF